MQQVFYGWRRQQPDKRDRLFEAPSELELPALVDMRGQCPPIYDQGQYGSCTANAGAAAFEFDVLKQKLTDFMPSRFYLYYFTRVLDGDAGYDGGGTIRNANKALAKNGICPESIWPYSAANLLARPTSDVQKVALPDAISAYMAVKQDLGSMKATLAGGFPIQIGFTVYSSFEGQQAMSTGIVPLPDVNNEQVLGGHAVLIVGYADAITVAGQNLTNVFIVRNSWGTGVMDKGYFYMPYAYFTDAHLASDLWVINAVPGNDPTPTPAPPNPCPPCAPCPPCPCVPATGFSVSR